jgi:hypothetical protein
MENSTQPPTPHRARPPESRLKMHLRLLTLDRSTYRVVTLRPGITTGFSTNFYHQSWHIVTSQQGARLLGRLLWGLSYQRRPGTLLLIHGDHLLPTPFEAERSDPFLFAPAGLTRLSPGALRILKSRLPHLGPPATTIRWHTFGLDDVLERRQRGEDDPVALRAETEWLRREENRRLWRQERMERLGGIICYSAPPAILRRQALAIQPMKVFRRSATTEMDYTYLASGSGVGCWHPDGEVQIFIDYVDRVQAAVEARQELLPNPNQPVTDHETVLAISRRRDQIKARRVARRRRRARKTAEPAVS